MRIFLFCILVMRMGTEALTIAALSVTDTLISTTVQSVEEEIHSATFTSSDTEEALVSLVLVEIKNDSLFPTTAVIETTSPYLVPTLSPIVTPVSVGIVITQLNEPTEIEEIILSSALLSTTTRDTETILLLTIFPEMKTIAHNVLSSVTLNDEILVTASLTEIPSTTTSPSPMSSIVDQEMTSFTTSTSKPTSVVKKASVIDDIPKEISKPLFSPIIPAKRCCKDQHHLDNNECVATTNFIPFEPLSNTKKSSETAEYSFSWETAMLNCSEGFKLQEFKLDGVEVTLKPNKTGSFLQRTQERDGYMTKTTRTYCIGQQANGNYFALICVPDIQTLCDDTTCVMKCCAPDEVMLHWVCIKDTEEYLPTYHTIHGDKIPAPKDIRVVSHVPHCPHGHQNVYETDSTVHFYLLSTGKIYINKSEELLDSAHYCIDYYPGVGEFATYCLPVPSLVQQWKIKALPITWLISIVFLIIIVICHLFTPQLRNVQGLCFLAYSTALLMAYCGFFTSLMYTKTMKPGHCVFNAIFSQCWLLSAFFWLTVMCFDIWRVIRATVKCIPLSGILEKDGQKFLLYMAFAFGCPLVIAIVTLIMQFLPPEQTEGLIVPGFLKESCWFADDLPQFIYFYSIIALLNGFSLSMLCHILFMLYEAEQGFSCHFREQSNNRAFNRKHLAMFRQRLSLFTVMAVCWFTDVLSLEIPPKNIWIVTDILNTLQGVIVFIIFISSRKKRGFVKDAVVIKLSNVSSKLTKSTSEGKDTVGTPETSGGTDDTNVSSKLTKSTSEGKDTVGTPKTSGGTDDSGKELLNFTCASQGPSNTKPNQTLLVGERPKEDKGEGGIVNNGYDYKDDVVDWTHF